MSIRLVVVSLLHTQPPQQFMIIVFFNIYIFWPTFSANCCLFFFVSHPIYPCPLPDWLLCGYLWFCCLSDPWSFNRDIHLDTHCPPPMFCGLWNGDWPLQRRNWRHERHRLSRRHSWGCWLDLVRLGAAIYLDAAGHGRVVDWSGDAWLWMCVLDLMFDGCCATGQWLCLLGNLLRRNQY